MRHVRSGLLRAAYYVFGFFVFLIFAAGCENGLLRSGVAEEKTIPIVAEGAEVTKLAGGFSFTEGPTADIEGNVYFTDIPNNRIHKWSVEGKVSVYKTDTGGANGLFFTEDGDLLACSGGNGMVVRIDKDKDVYVLADKFRGKKFNSPNDLWIDPQGGVYFTDPRYGGRENLPQDCEGVYYIRQSGEVVRVVGDMVRPNGVIGTEDGKKLYVTDHGGGKTWVYGIKRDGRLERRRLFVERGSDGMTIDEDGNIYLTTDAVEVFNDKGELVERIEVPERPANVCFGGRDRKTLFITARTSVYAVKMRVKGGGGNEKLKCKIAK
jgi:gluconolactonase